MVIMVISLSRPRHKVSPRRMGLACLSITLQLVATTHPIDMSIEHTDPKQKQHQFEQPTSLAKFTCFYHVLPCFTIILLNLYTFLSCLIGVGVPNPCNMRFGSKETCGRAFLEESYSFWRGASKEVACKTTLVEVLVHFNKSIIFTGVPICLAK